MSLYYKIADEILKKIKQEEWPQGYMIPSEKELCEQFAVSRPTVRSALAMLVNQGYLLKIKGKGSFVSKPKTLEDTTIFIESFSREMRERGLEIETEVMEQRVLPADETVAERLGIQPGEDVFKLARLRYIKDSFDEGPITYNIAYLPARYTFLQKCDFEKASLTSTLRENHVECTHLEKSINAVLLEGRMARMLGVPENSLGICVRTVGCSEDRREIVEYTDSYYPSDRNSFILKIRV